MDAILQALMHQAGITYMGVDAQLQDPNARLYEVRKDEYACDAQPALITTSNAGIPSFLSTYIDPKMIDVLVSPMKAAEIVGNEVKKGDWVTKTAMFPVAESTGEVTAYGDFNETGRSGSNVNWVNRQSFHYQTMTEWGEEELATMGLGKVDWANSLNVASILTLNKYQNKTYFFGVAGLENYGLLNDPALSAPITPAGDWSDPAYTALEVFGDIQALYSQLQTQAVGLIDLETTMTLAMSPTAQTALTKTTEFNVNVFTLLKTNFPNIRVMTAPEYDTDSGRLVQLIADQVENQRTVDVAFTEKLRAHPIVVGSSNFRQKKSQGTWGAIIYRPFLIAQMLGV